MTAPAATTASLRAIIAAGDHCHDVMLILAHARPGTALGIACDADPHARAWQLAWRESLFLISARLNIHPTSRPQRHTTP